MSTMMKPPVSVILTTYNGATRGYLEEAIESVLGQTYPRFELIIVDDGSSDATKELCAKYLRDPRVIYKHQENKGLAAARNTGITLSSNEYICFLDDDDAYEPDKLLRQIAFFADPSHSKTGMVYTGLLYVDEAGRLIGKKIHPANGDIYEHLFYGNTVCAPSSSMVKKSVLDKVGLFKEELKSCEDYDLWLRIAKDYHIYSLDDCLVRYRIHQNKMSANFKKMHDYQEYVLFLALQQAPDSIRAKKSAFYHRYHTCCAHQYLGAEDFKAFRRHFRLSRQFGRSGLIWRLRYLLTYCPPLFRVLKKIKKKVAEPHGPRSSV